MANRKLTLRITVLIFMTYVIRLITAQNSLEDNIFISLWHFLSLRRKDNEQIEALRGNSWKNGQQIKWPCYNTKDSVNQGALRDGVICLDDIEKDCADDRVCSLNCSSSFDHCLGTPTLIVVSETICTKENQFISQTKKSNVPVSQTKKSTVSVCDVFAIILPFLWPESVLNRGIIFFDWALNIIVNIIHTRLLLLGGKILREVFNGNVPLGLICATAALKLVAKVLGIIGSKLVISVHQHLSEKFEKHLYSHLFKQDAEWHDSNGATEKRMITSKAFQVQEFIKRVALKSIPAIVALIFEMCSLSLILDVWGPLAIILNAGLNAMLQRTLEKNLHMAEVSSRRFDALKAKMESKENLFRLRRDC